MHLIIRALCCLVRNQLVFIDSHVCLYSGVVHDGDTATTVPTNRYCYDKPVENIQQTEMSGVFEDVSGVVIV